MHKNLTYLIASLLVVLACPASAQDLKIEREITVEKPTYTDDQMRIRTPWGYFDDIAEAATEKGLILTLPEGFTAWSSGYSRGAVDDCQLLSDDGEAVLILSPALDPSNVATVEYKGNIVAACWRSSDPIEPSERNPQAIEIFYEQLRSRKDLTDESNANTPAPHKEMSKRKARRLFNAERGYISEGSFISEIDGRQYHTVHHVLKKGDKMIYFTLRMTDEGLKNKRQYLEALYKAVRFE